MKRQTRKDKELLLLRMRDFHDAIRDYDANKMTEDFLERCERQFGFPKAGLLEQIDLVRSEDHSPLGMEMYFALARFMLWKTRTKVILDDAIRIVKEKKIRSQGGRTRAAKFDVLRDETIRLYKTGQWTSVPQAAADITPVIVKMSMNGNGDLFHTTTKPLEWIREYNRKKKYNRDFDETASVNTEYTNPLNRITKGKSKNNRN